MAGDAADLVFTDPPYNVDYEGLHGGAPEDPGRPDVRCRVQAVPEAAFRSCRTVVKPGASLYVCHSSSWQREFQNALEVRGLRGPLPDHLGEEHLRVGLRPLQIPARADFLCPRGRPEGSLVWRQIAIDAVGENKPAANRIHPTAKPVELIERALLNSSKAGDIVADLFGGSGSTLIGCERREPQGAADGDRSEVRRLHRSAVSGIHGQTGTCWKATGGRSMRSRRSG